MSIYSTPPGIGSESNLDLRAYPNPFSTYATMIAPRTIDDVLYWGEHLWSHIGVYAEVGRKVARYFLTRLDIKDCSDDEKKKWEHQLITVMGLLKDMAFVGDDVMCYGNAFVSVVSPFRRFLHCDRCHSRFPIAKIPYTFKGFKFQFECLNCKSKNTVEKPIDIPSQDENKVKLKRWNPHEIRLRQHPISLSYKYFWRPPGDIISAVKAGDKFYIEEFPWEMIEAIRDRKAFEFADDVVYHIREETLAGISTRGWGLPRFLTNFSNAFYFLLVRMYNEVIAAEYIVPTRIVSPAAGTPATGDPMLGINLGDFKTNILSMLQQARSKPGGYHALPFPVEYQSLSGEGLQFSTKDLMDQALDMLLNASGYPAELFKGTLQLQVMGPALRLFEQTWPHIVVGYNGLVQWVVDTVASIFNWEKCGISLKPVTFADDVEIKQLLFQLAASKQIPMKAALETVGLDGNDMIKGLFDEQRQQMEEQQKFNMEQEHKKTVTDQMSGAGGGGAGGAGGVSSDPTVSQVGDLSGASIGEMTAKAEEVATKLLQMPQEQRRKPMLELKKYNETLHGLVKAKMESMRSEARSVGGPQALQQMVQPEGQQAAA